MKRPAFAGAALYGVLISSAFGQTIKTFTPACETALALSAAPSYMRDASGVYLLEDEGFTLSKESKNGYYCIVVRENYEGVVPQCFDPVSTDGHLKVHLTEAKRMLDGASLETIRAERKAGFETGAYKTAGSHGVVYMASEYNYVFTLGGSKLRVKPHVMFHAPNMSNEDIGAVMPDALSNRGMPFMNAPGPLGFMISFVERATDSSNVEASCKGQLPDPAEWEVFPAQ